MADVTNTETLEEKPEAARRREALMPALVLVFAANSPECHVHDAKAGPVHVLGRDPGSTIRVVDDKLVSGHHADVSYENDAWVVRDHASRNGTYVDGERVDGELVSANARVLRVGGTLYLLVRDFSRFIRGKVSVVDGRVRGPDIAQIEALVAAAARDGRSVLITGESGTGKEHMARVFYNAGTGSSGPFVDLNCATIQPSIAEAELFGVRKGAFSGATEDRPGLIVSADGGVLFLDEVGELELAVQPKLLRVLETKRVQAVGSTVQKPVQVLVCAATLRDLETAAEQGTFRQDLLMRLAQRPVHLPPLRDRPEEIPFFIELALAQWKSPIRPTARFVEACLLRSWAPTNVRALLNEVKLALDAALAAGAPELTDLHLRPERPRPPTFSEGALLPSLAPAPPTNSTTPPKRPPSPTEITSRKLLAAYEVSGNVAEAGKSVGLSRSRAYTLLAKLGVRFRPGSDS